MKETNNTSYTSGYKTTLSKQERVEFREKFCQKSLVYGFSSNVLITGSIYLSYYVAFFALSVFESHLVLSVVMLLNIVFVLLLLLFLAPIVVP